MLNFCTLFNSNYLARGLAMYESLLQAKADFHLYVFAFDDACYQYLRQKDFPRITPIALKDFEDGELLQAKNTRTMAEYCWTCTPSTILYCLQRFPIDNCTYIDADMIFYSDPSVLIKEMGDKSVLITEHRYTKQYNQSKNGIYCVQFMSFKKDACGLEVLRWWRDRCLEWCYDRLEDGKFGDQKYLDDWTQRFSCVHVLEHLGGGVAPWNLQQYLFFQKGDAWWLREKTSGREFPLVFFHFHGLRFYAGGKVALTTVFYEVEAYVKASFYLPYVRTLLQIAKGISADNPAINANGASGMPPSRMEVIKQFLKFRLFAFLIYKPAIFRPAYYNFKKHDHILNVNTVLT